MSDQPSTIEPDWPVCDVKGCVGIRMRDEQACLVHVEMEVRKTFLAALKPGVDIDLRGVVFVPELLDQVLAAVEQEGGSRTLGNARFDGARFDGAAWFGHVRFNGIAAFDGAQFGGEARFDGARFAEEARFVGARFGGVGWFNGVPFRGAAEFSEAQFHGDAAFDGAQFSRAIGFEKVRVGGDAWFAGAVFSNKAAFDEAWFNGIARFERAQFGGIAVFNGANFAGNALFGNAKFGWFALFGEAQFGGAARFEGTEFCGDALFGKAQFKRGDALGPLCAVGVLGLDGAAFEDAIVIEAATSTLSCLGTRFNETATLRLRYAEIAVDGAVFTKPSTIAFAEDTFKSRGGGAWEEALDEQPVAQAAGGRSPRPRLQSLRRVDVAGLTLSDLDLSACLFQGSHNLDELRIEGGSPFATTPTGWRFGRVGGRGLPVWRWTRRWTLAEEHHWRASQHHPATPNGRPHPKQAGWYPPAVQPPEWLAERTGQRVQMLLPDRIALLYRALRKGWEDSKNEPGAGDFYYGEMEMRRRGPTRPWEERVILTLYWLISGYGLRGWRALAWLAAVVVGLAVLLELVGFARHPSPSTAWGSLLYAARSTLSITDPEAQLTGWGKLLQIILRLAGPVLLGLALLAVRNRVKR